MRDDIKQIFATAKSQTNPSPAQFAELAGEMNAVNGTLALGLAGALMCELFGGQYKAQAHKQLDLWLSEM